MALVVADRVLETTNSPGLGSATLLGSTTGYTTFSSAIGNGNTTFYCIVDQSGPNWEVGIGTYSSIGNTLSRTTVLSSSNGGSAVNFNLGTQNVFVTYPSEKSIFIDASGNTYVPNLGATTPSTGAFTTLSTTGLASLNSLSTANATITGGSISGVSLTLYSLNSTPIGNTTPSTGSFTNVTTPKVTFPTGQTIGASSSATMKNRIINGGMVIDQRNNGASVTPANGDYLVDRWQYVASQSSKFTAQQNAGSVTLPVGFTNYLGFTSSSAYSVLSTDYFLLQQKIEGFNISDLAWGTANAKTVTLSFQVYSSLTGTFGGVLTNNGATPSYPFSFSIPVANTWTSISITIVGPTTGTWLSTNGIGIYVRFSLGTGSGNLGTAGSWQATNYLGVTGQTNIVGTSGATFYITGVQLEVGTVASSFDYRDYGRELIMCQRYAWVIGNTSISEDFGSGWTTTTTSANVWVQAPVTMRTIPSVQPSGSTSIQNTNNTVFAVTGVSINSNESGLNRIGLTLSGSSFVANTPVVYRANTGSLIFSSEL